MVPAAEADANGSQEEQWAKAGEKAPKAVAPKDAVSPRTAKMLGSGRPKMQLEKKATRDFSADMKEAGVAMPRSVVLAKGPPAPELVKKLGFQMRRTRLWTLEVIPPEGTVTVADRLVATSKLRAAALSGDQAQLFAAVAHAEALGMTEEAQVSTQALLTPS